MLNYGVTFNLDSAKVFSPAIYEAYFSYHKDIWIAVTDYYLPTTKGWVQEIMKCMHECVRPSIHHIFI